MNAIDRVSRNFEILLARAAGATAPELSERFGLGERQIRRILTEIRATRRGQDIEAAHQLAESRLQELYRVVELQGRALDEISNPFTCVALTDTMLAYFREIREIESSTAPTPDGSGSDSSPSSSGTQGPGMSSTTTCTPSTPIGCKANLSARETADINL
jgi:hypothetical protein